MRDQDLQMKYKQLRVLGVRVRQFDTIDEVLAHLTHEQILQILNRHERNQKRMDVYIDLQNGRTPSGVIVEHR
jgi:hypothetical protein